MGFFDWFFGTKPEIKIIKKFASTNQISWEIDHPERVEWSGYLMSLAMKYLSTFEQASDITTIRPDWASLTNIQKARVIVQMFCAIAFYESSWDPRCASVDVGTEADRNTWSIGLLQMSVCDQENYDIKLGYTYTDLITATSNLNLGFAIMAQQIQHVGKIIMTKGEGCYWSTFSYNYGEESHVEDICAMTQSLVFD